MNGVPIRIGSPDLRSFVGNVREKSAENFISLWGTLAGTVTGESGCPRLILIRLWGLCIAALTK